MENWKSHTKWEENIEQKRENKLINKWTSLEVQSPLYWSTCNLADQSEIDSFHSFTWKFWLKNITFHTVSSLKVTRNSLPYSMFFFMVSGFFYVKLKNVELPPFS